MIPVGKSIGVFKLDRIAVSYNGQAVTLGLYASFDTGGLKLELDGLSFSYDLKKHTFGCRLAGLMIDKEEESFSMLGKFVNSSSGSQVYSGQIRIRIGDYGINVLGEYQPKPFPSGFLFGMVQGAFGGPPCFVVDGLAAGVGYARSVQVPDIESLEQFPLLEVMSGKLSPETIAAQSENLFPPAAGTNWAAAGIRANSFKMAESSVLLLAILGKPFLFDILGSTAIQFPRGGKKILADIGLLIKITIDPKSGVIPIEGILTKSSYIMSKDCRISGGFAFYLWYQGEHAGDFVLSVGGYRNGYQKPDHYPAVDRLQLTWKLSDNLNAQGSLYCALTPSCIMAGGALSLNFDWKCIHAWFDAYIDIFIGWKPYSYAFDIGVTIGVKANLKLFHINLELGCSLSVWGPEFSGIAKIHLWIISFDISFGSGSQKVDTISEAEFCESFLKSTKQNDSDAAFGGSTITIAEGIGADGSSDRVKVNAEKLCIITKSPLIAASIKWNDRFCAGDPKDKIYIRPCKKEAAAVHEVTLTRLDKGEINDAFQVEPVLENVPTALWGREDCSSETMSAYTGLRISAARQMNYWGIHCQNEVRTVPPVEAALPSIAKLPEQERHKDPDEADNVKFDLLESCVPALKSGDYRITVRVDGDILGKSEVLTQDFSVEGPRFDLKEEVVSIYPGSGAEGHFGKCLPHVLLKRKTIPWERGVSAQAAFAASGQQEEPPSGVVPWLWLMLLSGNEIVEINTGTAEKVTAPADKIRTPELTLNNEEKGRSCQYIDVDQELFSAILPSKKELSWLSHGRSLSGEDKAENSIPSTEWVSCVISNRLPETQDSPVKNRAYLVSLEGCEGYWSDQKAGFEKVRVLVMYSWDFYSRTEEEPFVKTVASLDTGLLTRESPEGSDLYKKLINNGYSPMQHNMQDGSQTISFYRGPFTPVEVPGSGTQGPLHCADSLYRYDSEKGAFDVSYAIAWQLGRLLALGNESVSEQLLSMRNANKRALQEKMLKSSARTEGKKAGSWLLSGLNEKGDEIL
ncbi:MAG: hypothetical protein Q4C91_06095 [Eubacteriales bacterium]|nr:hypothetical protein [Eubacteriales bacterium]